MIRRITGHVKKIYAAIALLSVELIVVLALFTSSFFVFLFIAERVFLSHKVEFDNKVFHFLSSQVNDLNTQVMEFFTFLGTSNFLLPANILLVAYFAFIQKHRWYSIKIPAISLSSLILMTSLKQLFDRPRPDSPLLNPALGLSFPSGHALMSVTFYGLLVYIVYEQVRFPYLKWTLIATLVVLIHLIGFSRIYLRVHYASDVMAGFALGLIWLVISLWVLKRIEKFTRREIAPAVKEEKTAQA